MHILVPILAHTRAHIYNCISIAAPWYFICMHQSPLVRNLAKIFRRCNLNPPRTNQAIEIQKIWNLKMNLFLICCTFLVSHLFVFYLESWLDTFLNELSRKMNLVKIFLAHLAALSCNIEEMRDTNKNKLVPNVAQERRQIMKFNLPILGSSPAGNSIQTETHKFSQTNSQPRPQIFTQPLKYHCVLH